MSVREINKKMYECICERPECGHIWESETIPDRCARCKYTSWNGVDKRTKEYRESQKKTTAKKRKAAAK